MIDIYAWQHNDDERLALSQDGKPQTLNNSTHTLHTLLPPLSSASQYYHLRRRTHDRWWWWWWQTHSGKVCDVSTHLWLLSVRPAKLPLKRRLVRRGCPVLTESDMLWPLTCSPM